MGGCSLKVLVPVLGISCHYWLGSAQDSRLTFSAAFVFAFVKYQKLQLCANSSFGQCWAWLAGLGFWAAALWALHCYIATAAYKLQSRRLLSAWLSCSSMELPLVGFCFNTGNARAAGTLNLLDSTQILWTPNSLLRATIKVTILIHLAKFPLEVLKSLKNTLSLIKCFLMLKRELEMIYGNLQTFMGHLQTRCCWNSKSYQA